MNAIINSFKQMRITTNLIKNNNNLLRRYSASIADYKITWERPEKISYISPERSGDQGLEIDVKPTDIAIKYKDLPELKDANDIVKKMFTLQFLPGNETIKAKNKVVLEMVKRHKLDQNSEEAKIATMTGYIYQWQEHLYKDPKNTSIKVQLLETIAKRKKELKLLRKCDYRRFEWLLEKLNLIYKPLPEPPHKVTRKDSLRRLTEKHCNKLTEEKLDKYKKELKELQKIFYKEKAEQLAFIREEEIACGLLPTVSEEDIALAKQKAQEIA